MINNYYEAVENAILYFSDNFNELPTDIQQDLLHLKKAEDPKEYHEYSTDELISHINDDLADEWVAQNCYEDRDEMLRDHGVFDSDFIGEDCYV